MRLQRKALYSLCGCGIAFSSHAQIACPPVTPLAGTNQVSTSSFFYDPQGNQVQVCNPLSQITTVGFDALNRRQVVTEPIPLSSGTTHPTITTGYDGRDQVVSVKDPRLLSTTYSINGLGNTTRISSPDTGSTNNTYDAVGNLKTSVDARADTSTYSYDGLNRVTTVSFTSGVANTFTYDGGSSPVQYDIGHLTGFSDESGSSRLYYDGFGRTVRKTQIAGAVTQNIYYTYGESGNTAGKMISMTYPSGAVLNFSFDASGRVFGISVTRTVSGSQTTQVLLTDIIYNPFGSPISWVWGNGTVYSRAFDLDGRLASFPLGSTSGTLTTNSLNRTVNYDAESRVQSISHTDSSGSSTSSIALADNASFGYDNLDRLNVYTPATTAQGYAYDLTGNRTSTTIGSNSYTDAISSTSNQLNSTTGPSPLRSNSYDAAGNLHTDGTYTYSYTARGRLASAVSGANTVAYLYNALGQRVTKTGPTSIVPTGANHYFYDEAGHLLGEYDASGNALTETVFLGDTPITVLRAN